MHDLQQTISIDELEAFLAVAQAGGFIGAARALERDASVISKRVQQLERRLQVPLFSRTTRKVVLTEAGELYFNRVRSVLDELKDAGREASDLASAPRGTLRVSLPNTFGRRWIAPFLPRFMAKYPEIRLDIRLTDRFVDLLAEGYDAAIRLGALADSSLTSKRVASYRNMIVAAPRYLSHRGYPRDPRRFATSCVLGFRKPCVLAVLAFVSRR
ncbi:MULTISPECIES: LysR family transcriptional regulator [Agrobacterium]|uniref:LysR family transcriptional regulator n=1 Tax=Agrobacterium TaxID=357 RepID=UPI001F2D4D72|nr:MULTISPECIES: LysR family transcriptional regulator [Agrobacterium]